jgi:hypothetical protein
MVGTSLWLLFILFWEDGRGYTTLSPGKVSVNHSNLYTLRKTGGINIYFYTVY